MTGMTVRPEELVPGDVIVSIGHDEGDNGTLLFRVERAAAGYCKYCGEYLVLRDGAWEADGLIGPENYGSREKRLACDRNPEKRHLP